MNILLVDDDYLLAKGTAKLIQRIGGHQVTITDTPAEIFQKCQAGEVDVVLMDVNLPGAFWEGQQVSGADLARLLKTQPATAHIPIIMVTAYAMLTERKTLLSTSRADELFTKPITDYQGLLQLIDRLCQNKSGIG
ncbi:MAG: response regulator [Oscillatoria princeps RMCB-10]|nr:response regulator [Oscillatoria princeps RMCB-10]